jgi:uncharacterized membrane protein
VATLTVWRFETPNGAEDAAHVLEGLQKEELITVQDAAVVSWPEGRKKPKTRQLHSLTGTGALTGTFWGLLFGLLFFIPVLGAAVGAASGAIVGALTDVGIDDDFIKSVRDKVTPGSSALFALTSGAVLDKVRDAMKDIHGELIQSNLSSQQEQQLREYFAAED